MKNTSKGFSIWAIIAIVAVIVVVIVLVVKMPKQDGEIVKTDQSLPDGSDMNNNGVLDSTEDLSEGSANATPGAVSLSYQQALTKYATARIQLDKACQATPTTATYKNGATIMIDNRSPEARTIRLGSMGTYSIKAWGFKVIKLSSSTLPNAMALDCGKSQNVAVITVQK
jgi:hypothetical protein